MTAVTVSSFSDLLLDMAEKVGETAQNIADDRKRKLNSSYYFISNKRNWWWRETSDATTPTTTALSYTLPTNFAYFHPKNPVKIGDAWRTIVPFADLQLHTGTDLIVAPSFVSSNRYAYIYGTSIYFVQESMVAGQTITYYYYKTVTALDGLTDVPLMPVEFRELISLYAAGMHLLAQGGSDAAEGKSYLELFNEYLKTMELEDDNRREMGVKRRVLDPEEASVFVS